MPVIAYPLNFATSFYFIWTFMHAWARQCPQFMLGCFICLLTSVLYYSTNNTTFRKIDMAVCQISIVYFMYISASLSFTYIAAVLCLCLIVYLYQLGTETGHSLVHFLANMGISFAIETCSSQNCQACI
jgi:hypothetical protein